MARGTWLDQDDSGVPRQFSREMKGAGETETKRQPPGSGGGAIHPHRGGAQDCGNRTSESDVYSSSDHSKRTVPKLTNSHFKGDS